jgi:DNA (cytosine-5)-methyltransferase 1
MSRPRLLDLFCGAGGAARGYQDAGFHVTGVDIVDQPNYCGDDFIQADVLEMSSVGDVDLIHASPPCQAYSSATPSEHSHADMYASTRNMLEVIGLPYVIENVIGAPYDHGIVLCGSMFDLEEDGEWIRRHRNFETSWLIFQPRHAHPVGQRALLVTGHAFIAEPRDNPHSRQGPFDLACRLMGIDWMTRKELVQAIPPAYTKFIGEAFLDASLKGDRK